ncbi:hypothetical protein CAEBREN_16110 [Caenorhabditis brenneri]|uniref:Uncharacterized protein n=1 Tax=Caenorhabditis brenneri TaxID=135651 RepID=G0MH17_CAEBE|nr:hypothetical protein CAEBREN_16110 [Caenorhabditis brenneri]
MASREKRALSNEDEFNAKRSRVVEQEEENQLEDIEAELEKDHESVSLPDSESYDLLSEEDGDVQEPEHETENTTPPAPPTPLGYSQFIEQENQGFVGRFKPYDGPRLENGRPDPQYISYLEEVFGFTDDDEKFEANRNDETPYHHRRHCLWPQMYNVVQDYKKLKPDEEIFEISLCHETTMSENFAENFERAVSIVMKEPRPSRFPQTEEEAKRKLAYENSRKEALQELSVDYHDGYATHPGSGHKYAYMFPVHFSYELIDYICTVMGMNGLPLMFLKNDIEKFYPEYDEINLEVRYFLESCFLMDTSQTEHFTRKVEDGAPFESNDEDLVRDLYEEMNLVFCYVFEEFVMYEAMKIAKREEEFAYLDGIVPENSFLRERRPADAHRRFQFDFKCPTFK